MGGHKGVPLKGGSEKGSTRVTLGFLIGLRSIRDLHGFRVS